MCRGFQQNRSDCIKLKSFYIRLSKTQKSLPDFLTLNYLPRIDDGPLEINGSRIRPDAAGFVTLHRVIAAEGAVYGCRERVRAGEGVRFEVLAGDSRLVKGIFRRNRGDDDDDDNWDLHCEGVAAAAEVCVATEDAAAICRKVVVVPRRRRRRRRSCGLEEIPEGRETEECETGECETGESETGECCCCCGGEGEAEIGGGDFAAAAEEGVGWAVDVGLWVVCLGVGYLVSRNTLKRLRRKLV